MHRPGLTTVSVVDIRPPSATVQMKNERADPPNWSAPYSSDRATVGKRNERSGVEALQRFQSGTAG